MLRNNESLLLVDGYMFGKDLLIKSEQLFSNVLKISNDTEIKDIETTKSLNYNDIKILINKTEKITLDSIDNKKISSTVTKKEINKKEGTYIKVSYILDINDFSKKLINGYLEDDEVLTIFASLGNIKKDELKKELNNYLKSIDDYYDENDKLKIDIYVDQLLGQFKEIVISTEKKDYYSDILTVTELVITKDKDKYIFYEKEADKVSISGTYEPLSKTITINNNSEYNSIDILLKQEKDNLYKMSINYKYGESSISIDATLTNTINKTSQTNDLTVSINYKSYDEYITGELKSTSTITKNSTVTPIESQNIKEYKELTSEEMEQIYLKISDIYELIMQDFMPNYNNQEMI